MRLQWGRDQLIAEIRFAANERHAFRLLQWGRDQLIAEMPYAQANTAAINLASMGPRSADRGNDPIIRGRYLKHRRFNGAAIS